MELHGEVVVAEIQADALGPREPARQWAHIVAGKAKAVAQRDHRDASIESLKRWRCGDPNYRSVLL
eukprot:2342004-Prymnesium_polylepis.2